MSKYAQVMYIFWDTDRQVATVALVNHAAGFKPIKKLF